MPKLFGLHLRDIVSTPGKLKLDANPVKPHSPARSSPSKGNKLASFRSAKLLKRLSKQLKTSMSTHNMGQREERRQSIDQRISDLSALIVPTEVTNVDDFHSGWVSRQNAPPEYDWTTEVPADANRSSGFRRRTALSNVIFDPATPEQSVEHFRRTRRMK